MVRTQLYLTDGQNERLKRLVHISGRSQSDLVREAIDRMLAAVEGADWKERLRGARGTWQGRDDLDDTMAEARRSLARNLSDA
ncbi:MAG: CopG family transcriptional regulator [Geminicoccaceae bacterium]